MTGCRARAVRFVVMMVLALAPIFGGVQASVAQPAGGQGGVIFESFSFGEGLGFDSFRQLSVPVVIQSRVASRADLAISTGFTWVQMGSEGAESLTLSGLVDTEARLTVVVRPERLRVFLTGSVPTGMGAVAEEELALLGPLSHDLLGFSTPTLGGGGSVGAGVAGAAATGSTSIGWAAHLRVPLSYEPVIGSDDEVRAGTEVRARLGVETPVGRRSFLRVAGVLSLRGKDRVDGAPVNGVGRRVAGYASLDTPLGGSVATLWTSGFYRSDPSLEATAVGASVVPRGGLLTAGARMVFAVGPVTRLEPEVEVRTSAVAPDAAGLDLETQGRLVRLGLRMRRPMSGGLGLVAEAGGLFGTLHEGVHSVDTRGLRASLSFSWTR